MAADPRRVRQDAVAELAAHRDAGAADRAAEHREHLMKPRHALPGAGKRVVAFQIVLL